MTVQQYNDEFLPMIDTASCFISMLELEIDHMDKELVDTEEVRRIFKIYGWSEETKEIILKALEYYRQHEGIEKLEMHGKNEIHSRFMQNTFDRFMRVQ